MLDRIENMGKRFGFKINATKTKLMVIGRQPIINAARLKYLQKQHFSNLKISY